MAQVGWGEGRGAPVLGRETRENIKPPRGPWESWLAPEVTKFRARTLGSICKVPGPVFLCDRRSHLGQEVSPGRCPSHPHSSSTLLAGPILFAS